MKAVRILVGPADGVPSERFVVTQHLCAKGVTFVTTRPIVVGTSITIDLLRLDQRTARATATVVGVQSSSDAVHLVGAEFDAPIVVSEFIMLDDE